MKDKSLSQQLDEVLLKASESFIRRHLKSDRDLAEFEAIKQAMADKQEELNRAYKDEYTERVGAAQQQLYDEAAQKNYEHPAPPGVPTNTSESILNRAHERVELAHQSDLAATRDAMQADVENLLNEAYAREQIRGRAVEQFLGASERRFGPDRRSGEDRRTRNQSMV